MEIGAVNPLENLSIQLLESSSLVVKPVTESNNIFCIENVIPQSDLEHLNRIIDQDHKDTSGFKRYIDGEVSTFVEVLRRNPKFREAESICRQKIQTYLFEKQISIPSKPFYVIRCVNNGSRSQAFTRHFDSHHLTMLIPMKLALGEGHNGDFVIYNKPRRLPSSFSNLIQKLIQTLNHYLPVGTREKLTVRDVNRGVSKKIPVVLGNVYFFNGFIHQHGNYDVELGERRSLLMHDFDPGRSFGLNKLARGLRRVHLIK